MNFQFDRLGAVLVAYSRDAQTGEVTRSWLRFDQAGTAYLRQRLEQPAETAERCQCSRALDPTPCEGPQDAVLILSATNTGAYGCETHGALRMAAIEGSRAVSHSVAGAAIRVHQAAGRS
ncbi:hypothetical protein [Streptomyces sp. NPDC088785]|uniref:hypothetical protein n=1 Tax=Streptomyces sp. NPDC088785 TaxID=3365897 RepID=UPI003801417C